MHPHVSTLVCPHSTLLYNLATRVERHGERLAVSFQTGEGGSQVSYAELWQRSTAVAELVRAAAPPGGDPRFVLIMLPNGLEYVASFYGCLLAGAVAVPFYPPSASTGRAAQAFNQRFGQVMRNCRPSVVILARELIDTVRGALDPAVAAGVHWVVAEDLPAVPADAGTAGRIDVRPDDLALLQYTSGSTMAPKGVMVSHANLVHNAARLSDAFSAAEGESATSWLPLYHDMGLIGMLCFPVFAGMSVHLTTPADFIRRPFIWLDTISRSRSAFTMAPNFAYDMSVRWVTEEQREGLDLGCLRHMAIAAEPIRPTTVEAFIKAYERHGLRPNTITPGYGMAENTLGVTMAGRPAQQVQLEVSAARLREGVAVPAQDEPATVIVGCGPDLASDIESVIVDPERCEPVPDGHVGEVWVTGPSVAKGYWGMREASDETFAAELPYDGRQFLRTGDLGLKIDKILYIVGRLKDLIIQHGVNHYPQDLEYTAEQGDAAVQIGGTVAFATPCGDGEGAVLVCELVRYGPNVDYQAVLGAVRRAVVEEHGVELTAVAIVRRGQIPKTTSGKVRRRASAQRWLAGEFDTLACWPAPAREAGRVFQEASARALAPVPTVAR